MLDRERRSLASVNPMEHTCKSLRRRYRPSLLADCPYKVTSVQFNPTGSELLSSYSEDYVYLFSAGMFGCGGGSSEITKPVYLSQCERYPGKRRRIDSVRSKPVLSVDSPPISSSDLPPSNSNEIPPPMKRLRLRGDWSDTGPEARPGDQSSVEGGTLMNRMSRMFTQWIDMSLQNPSDNGGSLQNPDGRGGEGEREGGHEGELGTSETDSPLVTSGSSENSFHLFSDSDSGHSNDPSPNSGADTPASSLANGLSSCNIDSGIGTKTHSDSSQSNRTSRSSPPDSGAGTNTSCDGGRLGKAVGSCLGNTQGLEVNCSQNSEGEIRKVLLEPVENSSTNSLTSKLPMQECSTSRKQECHGTRNSKNSDSKVQGRFDEKIALNENSTSKSARRETLTLMEGVEPQTQPTHDSVSSVESDSTRRFAPVVVESRTSSSIVPSIRIIDGDATDSDDMRSCDEQQESRDESHDRSGWTGADPSTLEEDNEGASTEEDDSSFEQPFMVYKGHRNARTMVSQF